MSDSNHVAATEAMGPSWFRELADANATLPIWLLLVFLTAGLTGLAVGLVSLLAG